MWTWNDAPMKFVSAAVGAAGLFVGSTYKGATFIDERYAHQEEFAVLVMMAEEDRANDTLRQIQARIWRLEEHYGLDHRTWPAPALEEVRDLEVRKEKLDQHLNRLDEQLLQQSGSKILREERGRP